MLCLSHMRKVYLLFLLFPTLLFFTAPVETNAQFTNSFAQTNPSVLSLSPRYPEPNEEVTAKLNDYSINTNGAKIRWFVDGREVPEAENLRSLNFHSGALGDTVEVIAITTLPNGSVLRAQSSVTPIRLDMLIEADSRVPSFYKGRAIPTSGGMVQVTALPFTGTDHSPESFSYTWKIGSEVQGGGSHFGKNTTSFTAGFEKEILVSVNVIDIDGSLVTSESIYVPLADPEMYFYVVNPLRGISEIAMNNNFIFLGEEIKVRAEPYFIDNALFLENPHQEWKLNRKAIQNPSTDQQEITLRRSGDSGSFSLEFHVRNLKRLLQGIKESVQINF